MKNTRQSRSNIKFTLIVFFDFEDVVHYEYATRGETINNFTVKSEKIRRLLSKLKILLQEQQSDDTDTTQTITTSELKGFFEN